MTNTELMDEVPSKTAYRIAALRAQHQVADGGSIFSDPLALTILGETAETLSEEGHPSLLLPGLRQFVAARSRFAEDVIAEEVGRGMRQVVLLGAGLDTFGLRNLHADKRVRVFEVDRPAVLEWKRRRIENANLLMPPELTFVAVNFEKQSFLKQLIAAGFRPGQPAFFSWLGLLVYLPQKTVHATLAAVAKLQNTEIVFDYAVPPTSLPPADRAAYQVVLQRAKATGEPWLSFFTPAQMKKGLTQLGFSAMEDLGPQEIGRRYFRGTQPFGLRLVRAKKQAVEVWA